MMFDLNAILKSIAGPDLVIQKDDFTDSIVFTNNSTKDRVRISCLSIEQSQDPMLVIMDEISKIIPQSSSESYDPNKNNYLKNRLFTLDEHEQILKVKNKIRHVIATRVPFIQMGLNMEYVVIAGGCFASLLGLDIVNDYDVFILDHEENRKIIHNLAVANKNDPEVRVGNSNYMDNDKIEETVFFKHNSVQYITTKYKSREELVNHFDFRHCCVSYDYVKDRLYMTREVYDLIKEKKLVQNSKRVPAQWRYEKFRERGWKIEPLSI